MTSINCVPCLSPYTYQKANSLVLANTPSPSPANPTFCRYYNGGGGEPHWVGYGSNSNTVDSGGVRHYFDYGDYFDTSHMPDHLSVAYLRSADAALEECMAFRSMAITGDMDSGARNYTWDYGGSTGPVTFTGCLMGYYQGGARNLAHFIRLNGNASRMMRDNSPMRRVVEKLVSENAKCAGLWPVGGAPYGTSAFGAKYDGYRALGVFFAGQSDGRMLMFSDSMCNFMVQQEARVGDYPGWAAMWPCWLPLRLDFYDITKGGDTYYADTHDFDLGQPNTGYPATAYPDIFSAGRAKWGPSFGTHPTSAGLSPDGFQQSNEIWPVWACIKLMAHHPNPPPNCRAVAKEINDRYAYTQEGYAYYSNGAATMSSTWVIRMIAP